MSVLKAIRESCSALLSESKDVSIDDDKLQKFASAIDVAEVVGAAGHEFPLRFPSIREHINFLGTMALLNFGSGYRAMLHKYCGRGAFDTMAFGCMGLHITKDKVDANLYCSFTLHDVHSFFQIPVDVEVEVTPATYMSKPHPLRPLADTIRKTLNETGATLRMLQCADFADFILGPQSDALVETKTAPLTAAALVDKLVKSIPAFADVHKASTGDVIIAKKAQLLVADLYRRLSPTDQRFDFPDIDELTVFADNVVPAVLRHAGVLVPAKALHSKIEKQKLLPAGPAETALRAATIVACDQIVAILNSQTAQTVAKAKPAAVDDAADDTPPTHSSALDAPSGSADQTPAPATDQQTSTTPTATTASASSSSSAVPAPASSSASAVPTTTASATATFAADSTPATTSGKPKAKVTAMLLDHYLWHLGKSKEYHKVIRHATQDTVFY